MLPHYLIIGRTIDLLNLPTSYFCFPRLIDNPEMRLINAESYQLQEFFELRYLLPSYPYLGRGRSRLP